MATRTASPPEHYTLTVIALSLAQITLAWTPLLLALPAAALTYLATVTAGAWLLRWHIPTTLAGTTTALRLITANALRLLAWAIQTTATAALHALAALHTKTLPAGHPAA